MVEALILAWGERLSYTRVMVFGPTGYRRFVGPPGPPVPPKSPISSRPKNHVFKTLVCYRALSTGDDIDGQPSPNPINLNGLEGGRRSIGSPGDGALVSKPGVLVHWWHMSAPRRPSLRPRTKRCPSTVVPNRKIHTVPRHLLSQLNVPGLLPRKRHIYV